MKECTKCYGRGYIGVDVKLKSKDGQPAKVSCPKCLGTGDREAKKKLEEKIAASKKVVETDKSIDVVVEDKDDSNRPGSVAN